jgi:23S rRNA (guanosine2251-2'-O)-methyltransferase
MTEERPPRPRRPRDDAEGDARQGDRPSAGRGDEPWRRDDRPPRPYEPDRGGAAGGRGDRDRGPSGGARDRGRGYGDQGDRGRGYGAQGDRAGGGYDRGRPAGRPWERGGPPDRRDRAGPGGARGGARGRDEGGRQRYEDDRPGGGPGRGGPGPGRAGGADDRGWSERGRGAPDRDRGAPDRDRGRGPGEEGAWRPRPRPWRPPDRAREGGWSDRPRRDDRPARDEGRPAYGPPGRGPGRDREFRPRYPDRGPAPYRGTEPAGRRWATDERADEATTGPVTIGPNEEVVAGRRPVEEAFAARRPALRLLVVPERRSALDQLVLHATAIRIPVVEVEGGTLTALSGFDGHQGVALVVEPRRWAGIDDIIAGARELGDPPLVLVLDSLEDPQNVGTLLRTADATRVHGVLFPTRRSAPIGPSAVKASAGAVEHLRMAPMDDLGEALVDLHARGLRIVAADEDAPLSYREADLRGPLAIVIGSEGQGLSATVRRRVDLAVRIPMQGHVASLNAAVAGSVLLFEAAAQRGEGGNRSEAKPRRRDAGGAAGGPGDERPGDERPGDERPGDERPGDERPGDERPGDERPGDERPGDASGTPDAGAPSQGEAAGLAPTAGWAPAEGGEEQVEETGPREDAPAEDHATGAPSGRRRTRTTRPKAAVDEQPAGSGDPSPSEEAPGPSEESPDTSEEAPGEDPTAGWAPAEGGEDQVAETRMGDEARTEPPDKPSTRRRSARRAPAEAASTAGEEPTAGWAPAEGGEDQVEVAGGSEPGDPGEAATRGQEAKPTAKRSPRRAKPSAADVPQESDEDGLLPGEPEANPRPPRKRSRS